jgi:hypothetical protein
MSRPIRFRDVACRLLVAVAAGLAVAGIGYVCVYFDQRGQYGYQRKGLATLEKLDNLQHEIERHRQTTGYLPADLGELSAVRFYHRFSTDASGRVLDMWDRPFHYRVEGDSFVLYSLGADGQPGGSGRDADLYAGAARNPPELPTLRQFTYELQTGGVRRTCILTGACAALVCLIVTRRRSGTALLTRTAATVVVFIIIAVAWSGLHIPTSH